MIVPKIFKEGTYTADIPDNIKDKVRGFELLSDGESYRLDIDPKYTAIRSVQGKSQLYKMGLYDTVNNMIAASDDFTLKLFWDNETHWHITSDTVQSFATQLGIDLFTFYEEASKINI